MPRKEFTCRDERWEAVTTGTATGFGASDAGYRPPVSRWSVDFRCLSDPKKQAHGAIGADDPNKLSDEQLCRELRRALEED